MTDENKVAHVHTALAAILKELSVEKGGTLPQNMGGRGYITASDLSNEVKRKFVENDLILLPTESIISHEVIGGAADRKTVAVSITGYYEILSTQDGSSVVISGIGDGLAIGTAVSSNIASTNALKNALLRTFLVTETSVEDQAKEGVPEPKAAPAQPTADLSAKIKKIQDFAVARTEMPKGKAYIDSVIEAEPEKFTKSDGTIGTWEDVKQSEKHLDVLLSLIGA